MVHLCTNEHDSSHVSMHEYSKHLSAAAFRPASSPGQGESQPILICGQVGSNYFRIHPKGTGIVCTRKGGLRPLTFVEEYLGEVHAPWRWFEIQVFLPETANSRK